MFGCKIYAQTVKRADKVLSWLRVLGKQCHTAAQWPCLGLAVGSFLWQSCPVSPGGAVWPLTHSCLFLGHSALCNIWFSRGHRSLTVTNFWVFSSAHPGFMQLLQVLLTLLISKSAVNVYGDVTVFYCSVHAFLFFWSSYASEPHHLLCWAQAGATLAQFEQYPSSSVCLQQWFTALCLLWMVSLLEEVFSQAFEIRSLQSRSWGTFL